MSTRFSRIVLLLRCYLAYLARGGVDQHRELRVVVAVLTGKLGDVVCGTPILRALRAHLPHARLVAAGAPFLPALLKDSGLADAYIDIDAPDAEALLRAERAAAAVVTGPSFVPAAKLYLAGTPLISVPWVEGGYSPFETLPYRLLRPLLATYPYRMGAYAPRERLRSLEPLGIVSEDTTKKLGYSKAAEERVSQFLRERGIRRGDFVVGVSATAGNKIKEWPEERFAAIVDYLTESEGAKVVLIGGPGDKKEVDAVTAHLKNPAVVLNTQGLFGLDELKALIARLSLFVAVDTGPIYIAEAFEVPTVDIVGPLDEREQPPRGPFNRNVLPPGRTRSYMSILNARGQDPVGARKQTLAISTVAVIEEVKRLMRDLRASKGS